MRHTNHLRALVSGIAAAVLLCGALQPLRANPPSAAESPFQIRGIKGLWWDGAANYRLAIPWLAEHHLNFLMLCYTSWPASATDWRSDYTPDQMTDLKDLADQAGKSGINLCLSFNPGIWSKPPLQYSSEADFGRALAKVKAVHALGIHWFALCLDDISRGLQPADTQRFGTLQAAQIYFVNRLWKEMQSLDPKPRLVFCPSAYTTEDASQHLDYIQAIGAGIDPGVMMFWTGPQVCSASITADDARKFGAWIKRKPFIWDNYPVNDMFPWRPLLAPLKNRSTDLGSEVSGYLCNSMKQWYATRIPVATTAAYLNDPAGYRPDDAMDAAIAEHPKAQQPILRALVKLYGTSFWGDGDFPPRPRPRNKEEAAALLVSYRKVKDQLAANPGLAGLYRDVEPTLDDDINRLEHRAGARTFALPVHARGDDLEGGAGEEYGYRKYDQPVNYVYAKPTGRSEMSLPFTVDKVPESGLVVRLTARNDDSGKNLRIRVRLNDAALVEGESPYNSQGFQMKEFRVPASAVATGKNVLVIENLEQDGPLGNPPWFMVSAVQILPAK